MTEEAPLATLYLQIEYGDIPSEILGIQSKTLELEIRDAYRAVAPKIRPERARNSSLREVHVLVLQRMLIA